MSNEDEPDTRGWDAITAACQSLYGNQDPRHYGTLISYRLGGPDPLQGISAYWRDKPAPHWHLITYGFSELYDKESEDPTYSGYGFELTFRLKATPGDDQPPTWAMNFLQNLARYVFTSGNVFNDGDWMPLNGPIASAETTAIVSMAIKADPELEAIDTPNGRLAFLQVIGLTDEEEQALKRWSSHGLLDALSDALPLWVTDLSRESLVDIEPYRTLVADGTARDGSSTGHFWIDHPSWKQEKRLLRSNLTTVSLGAQNIAQIVAILPLRLPFGRPLRVLGPDASISFIPATANEIVVNDGVLELKLKEATVNELATLLKPERGTYRPKTLDNLVFDIRPTLIKDANGKVVETIG